MNILNLAEKVYKRIFKRDFRGVRKSLSTESNLLLLKSPNSSIEGFLEFKLLRLEKVLNPMSIIDLNKLNVYCSVDSPNLNFLHEFFHKSLGRVIELRYDSTVIKGKLVRHEISVANSEVNINFELEQI